MNNQENKLNSYQKIKKTKSDVDFARYNMNATHFLHVLNVR